MPSIAYQALGSLYQILGDAAADGLSAEHLGGLERCHRDAVMDIAARWPSWSAFADVVDGAMASAISAEEFTARVIRQKSDSRGTPPAHTRAADAVGAIADGHAELGSALEKFRLSEGGADQADALTWVLECALRLSRIGKLEQLARAAAWLSEETNDGKKGRRALAFSWAILGDPRRFRSRAGRECETLAEVCQAHNFSPRRLRDHLHELARLGIAAPGYASEHTGGRIP